MFSTVFIILPYATALNLDRWRILSFGKEYINRPFPELQILDTSKLKEFADDNFKFDENVRKLSKWVENTVGNREISPYTFTLTDFSYESLWIANS